MGRRQRRVFGLAFLRLPPRFFQRALACRQRAFGALQCLGVFFDRLAATSQVANSLAHGVSEGFQTGVFLRGGLVRKFGQTLAQIRQQFLAVLDAAAANALLAAVFVCAASVLLHLALPFPHLPFQALQTFRRSRVLRFAGGERRTLGLDFLLHRVDAPGVRLELRGHLALACREGVVLAFQLGAPLAVEVNGLFQGLHANPHLEQPGLGLVGSVAALGVGGAAALQRRVQRLAFAECAGVFHLQRGGGGRLFGQRRFQSGEADRVELRGARALLLLELAVALGGAGLALQMRQLTVQFFAQVGVPLKILLGVGDAVLRLAAPLLVLGDPGGLFEIGAQLLGLGVRQLGDHALLDDGVAARPEAGAKEHVRDVAAAATAAVQVVGGLGVAADFAANGDLRVVGEAAFNQRAAHAAGAVVEHELDGGETGGRAAVGTVEDDVRERLAAQLPRRTLPHDPAHGVNDVRLAASVRPHDGGAVARQGDRCWINERFEPRELDFLKAHLNSRPSLSKRGV